jgi:hypothetical protein
VIAPDLDALAEGKTAGEDWDSQESEISYKPSS